MSDVATLLEKWWPHTDITPDEFRKRVGRNQMLLLGFPNMVDPDAIVGLELESDSVHVTMVCGSGMSEWLPDLVAEVERLARTQGRPRITTRGRRAWDRILAPYGFKREGAELNKVVSDGVR